MSGALRIAGAVLAAAAAAAAVLLFFAARDDSTVGRTGEPGRPYRGVPILSPGLEDAVARGNVVVLYRDDRPPYRTADLQAGAGPELRAAGLAVLLEREPTLRTPLAAISKTRIQTASRPEELEDFVNAELGR